MDIAGFGDLATQAELRHQSVLRLLPQKVLGPLAEEGFRPEHLCMVPDSTCASLLLCLPQTRPERPELAVCLLGVSILQKAEDH